MKHFMLTVLLFLCVGIIEAEEKRFLVPLDNSPAFGPADAPVTIVEFIDFQ